MTVVSIFSRRPKVRVPHDEPGYDQRDFAAEYNEQVGKATTDFDPIVDYVAAHVDASQPARILEIGPGPGWIAIRLALLLPEAHVTGLDLSEAFVDIANENSRREGVGDRAVFVVGDATRMNFPDGSFDAVCSYQSLHYWEPVESGLNEIARVLKPSGAFCIGDDRRDMKWRGRLQVALIRRFISRRIGSAWAQSISSCLTPAEAAEALDRSDLRGRWHMTVTPRSLLITDKPHN